MKKTVQVIMLPTKDNKYLPGIVQRHGKDHYHLYFTSNEVIKEGDKVLESFTNSIMTIKRLNNKQVFFNETDKYTNLLGVFKVIATTDKSLNLPLIPQSFVEEYVKSNSEIKKVELDLFPGTNEVMTYGYFEDSEGEVEVSYKKQTLEEAAQEYIKTLSPNLNESTKDYILLGIQFGANWQKNNS